MAQGGVRYNLNSSPWVIAPLIRRFEPEDRTVRQVLDFTRDLSPAERPIVNELADAEWDQVYYDLYQYLHNPTAQQVDHAYATSDWIRHHRSVIQIRSPDAVVPIQQQGVGFVNALRLPLDNNMMRWVNGIRAGTVTAVHSFCVVRSGELYFMDVDMESIQLYSGGNRFNIAVNIPGTVAGGLYFDAAGVADAMRMLGEVAEHTLIGALRPAPRREDEFHWLYMLFGIIVTNICKRRHLLVPRRRGSVDSVQVYLDLKLGVDAANPANDLDAPKYITVVEQIEGQSLDEIFSEANDEDMPGQEQQRSAFDVCAEMTINLANQLTQYFDNVEYHDAANVGVSVTGMRIIFHRNAAAVRTGDPRDPATQPALLTALPSLVFDYGGCFYQNHHVHQSTLKKHISTVDSDAAKVANSHHNCGLRELFAQAYQLHPTTYRDNWKKLADYSFELRNDACERTRDNESNSLDDPYIPPVGPLHPTHLWSIITHTPVFNNVFKSLKVYIAPHCKRRQPLVIEYNKQADAVRPEQDIDARLFLSNGHFFSIKPGQEDVFEEQFMLLRFCVRCVQCVPQEHECKPPKAKKVKVTRPDGRIETIRVAPRSPEPDHSHEQKFIFPPNDTDKAEPLPGDDSLLFMDYETLRIDIPSNVIGIDRGQQHQVYAFGVSTGDRTAPVYKYFGSDAGLESVKWLRDYVETYKQSRAWLCDERPVTLYFYNGSKFDFILLLDLFAEIGVFPDRTTKKDALTLKDGKILSCRFFDGALVLRDLFLFTLCSLKNACKCFGVSQDESKGEFDHELIKQEEDYAFRSHPQRRIDLEEYLDMDIISMRAIYHTFSHNLNEIRYVDNNGGDETTLAGIDMSKRITLSHAAFDLFKRTLANNNDIPANYRTFLPLPRSVAEDAFMRRAYFGGRVFPQLSHWQSERWDALLAEWCSGDFDGPAWRRILLEAEDADIDLDHTSLYPTTMNSLNALFAVFNCRVIPDFFCGESFMYVCDRSAEWDHQLFPATRFTPADRMKNNTPKEIGIGKACRKFILGFQQWLVDSTRADPNFLHHARLCPQRIVDQYTDMFGGLAYNNRKMGAIVVCDVQPPRALNTPILPYKDPKHNHGLRWTLERHEKTSLVIDELLHAMVYGYRVKTDEIYVVQVFMTRLPIFRRFVDIFFKAKATAKTEAARQIAKRILNSCYGKTIQQIIFESIELIGQESMEAYDFADLKDIIPIVLDTVDHKRIKRNVHNLDEGDQREYVDELNQRLLQRRVVAWALKSENKKAKSTKPIYLGLQITAYARMIVNMALYNCGSLFDINALMRYTDTDSLVVRLREYNMLKMISEHWCGKGLGQLSDELKGGLIVRGFGHSPKFYILVFLSTSNKLLQKIKCKGVPHPKPPKSVSGVDGDHPDAEFWPVPKNNRPEEHYTLYDNKLNKQVNVYVSERIPERIINIGNTFADEQINTKAMLLGEVVFDVTWANGDHWIVDCLSHIIFEGLIRRTVKQIVVHFVVMKVRFFNESPGTRISGVHHLHVSRSIKGITWWDNPTCIRTLEDESGLSFPQGF